MAADPFVSRAASGVVYRWTNPYPDEPPHGFLLRLAAAHRLTSAAKFAADLGFREVTDAESCMAVVCQSPHVTEPQKETLWHWAAKPTHDEDGKMWHVLGGQTVRRDDFVISTRRFCPACLAEAAYHRAWFDLTFMVTCPLHGILLTDLGEGGARVGWSTASVDMTANGYRLSRAAPRRRNANPSFEGYVLGRLGLAEPHANPLLDRHRLGEVAESVRLMGLLSIRGYQRRIADIAEEKVEPQAVTAAGFSVLATGVEGVEDLFGRIAGEAPADTHGANKLFGWAYKTFTDSLPLALALRDVMVDVAHRLSRAGTRSSKSRPTSAVGPTIARLASENGLRAKDVLRVAERLECLAPRPFGPKTPNIVPADCVSVVLGGFRNSMTRERAATRLAIDVDTFTTIVRHGYLERFTGGHGGDRKDAFHFGDLIGFLERIPTIRLAPGEVGRPSPTSLVPLGRTLVTYGEAEGRLLDEVMAGRVDAYQTEPFVDDLDDVLIEPPAKIVNRTAVRPGTRSSRAPSTAMTKREAATLLDVSAPTIKLLVEHGHLGNLGGSQKRNMLDRGSVEALGAKYLAGRYYADVLGVDATHVGERLARLGIKDLLHEARAKLVRKEIGALYDRRIMRTTLDLLEDPDAAMPGRRAWKRFATYLGRGRRGLMIWTVKGELSATCADGAKEFVTRLTVAKRESSTGVQFKFTAEMTARDTEGRKVVDAMAARAASKRLPADLEYDVDPERGVLRAKVTASIASWPEHRQGIVDTVDPSQERADFAIMERTVLMLRAAFDEAERTDDIVPRDEPDDTVPPLRRAS